VNLGPQIFQIDHQEIIIGSANDANIVLTEDSVSPHHARLNQVEELYQIADLGTEAGTWVNYAPVSTEGSALNDGDLIHIGRVAFRFFNRLGASESK
jgi:pSer/pThr/pTyr-binding forkhead associated (FHA) protein